MLDSIFGPWEGGLASTGGTVCHPEIRVTPRRIACWNGQGAFACHNSVENSEAKIFAFTAMLATKKAS